MSTGETNTHVITMNQISRSLGILEGQVGDIRKDIEEMKTDIRAGHPCIQEDNIFNLKEIVVANKKLIDAATIQVNEVSSALNKAAGGLSTGKLFFQFSAWVVGTAIAILALWQIMIKQDVVYQISPDKVIEIIKKDDTTYNEETTMPKDIEQ